MATDIHRQRKFPRDIQQPVRQPVRSFSEQEVAGGKSRGRAVAVRADSSPVEDIHGIGHGGTIWRTGCRGNRRLSERQGYA